ncbi:MAG: hypothetical protein KIT58_01645 [Planctomycetota bacterium]|nr:hypothetical protein [Planctomycetota bacterium]
MRKCGAGRGKLPKNDTVDLDYCSVKFTLRSCPLIPHEPDDYILAFDGELVHFETNGQGEREENVGTVSGFVVQVARMWESGQSVAEACDAHSATIEGYHAARFDDTGQQLREDVCEGFASDLLIVDRIEILPRYRGARLGLLAMLTAIDTFGRGCGAVAIKPFPLQAEQGSDRLSLGRAAELELQKFTRNFARSQAKLRAYWGQAGFSRFEDTDYFVMDLAMVSPTKQALLGRDS